MKKLTLITSIAVIFLLLSIPKIVNAQHWDGDGYNIWNNNLEDVIITSNLRWGWYNSLLSNDE